MNYRSFHVLISTIVQVGVGAVAMMLLLASCGGGGHSSNDTNPFAPVASVSSVPGPNSFLIFPNPQSAPAIDSETYARAYYNAIDPLNERDTLTKWKAKNGFGDMTTGIEQQAIFGDVRDLGYGRHVTARWGNDDTWAFMVDNYSVGPAANYAYSGLNLDAAIAHDQRWYIGTNAIEISPGPNCPQGTILPIPHSNPNNYPASTVLDCKYITKFYNFNPITGARQLAADLDGRGDKAMPGICLACHGGRGDALLPAITDPVTYAFLPQFPIVGNPASGIRGDVKGKLHFFEVDSFGFSTQAGYTRIDQEAALKTLNTWVLMTYPIPSAASGVFVEDEPRPIALANEWQGQDAADIIKAAYNYGQPPSAASAPVDPISNKRIGMPSPTYNDTYIPPTWVADGQTTLYQNVVKPACRICHLLRGVAMQKDISFNTFSGFQAFADRIKGHVIDRGNMPLSRILNDRFWSTPSMYETLDQFLQASNPVAGSAVTYTVLDSSGNHLRPGRPVAIAGPDRVTGTTSTTLSAAGSLYADSYTWSIVSDPVGTATLGNATGVQTTFNAPSDGTYVVQLVASKGAVHSEPTQLKIVVNSTAWPPFIYAASAAVQTIPNPLPSDIRFANIKAVLQETGSCTGCHTKSPIAALQAFLPPVVYANIDRNGDGLVASAVGAADDMAFYNEIRGRINFSDIESSALLRHPAGYNHAAGVQGGFGWKNPVRGGVGITADHYVPGDPTRGAYDMFLNWILNGAPYQ